MTSKLFNEVFDMTRSNWQEVEPMRDVRMPVLETKRIVGTENFNALWTDGGLRPNPNNLAFLMQDIYNLNELNKWKNRLKTFRIRASLLVSDSSDELYLLQPRPGCLDELETQRLNKDEWHNTLVSPKPHLFTPKELAKSKLGQLSLADIEETNSEGSFNFLLREQQKKIEQAFFQGIQEAFKFVDNYENSGSSRFEINGHIIRFAIAYLAARILEDKNFFNAKIEDPIQLLERIGTIRNGFFKKARASADHIPFQSRKTIARHMGYQVSFVLADHRDVGRLYEQAIKSLKEQNEELDNENWGDLKQHYTPVVIAEKMLEALPLERLRPSERSIIDPSAGSGSLLLAATSRLAAMTEMTDISPEERNLYLKTHIVGNDLDSYASWIAQLRYFLASESLGKANEPCQISEILPFPDNFTNYNYIDLFENALDTAMLAKSRVIIANPPFEQKDNIQEAANFVKKALTWMDNGSQFAFVLPQSFLTGTKNQVGNIRNLLAQQCQILELWQFPEGVIGTNARQSTSIVIGIKGKPKKQSYTISRMIISGAKLDEIREKGFLGKSWICQLNLNDSDWSQLTFPRINRKASTIPLGNLFYIFKGQEPGKNIPVVSEIKANSDIKSVHFEDQLKLFWRLGWKEKNRLWANPQKVPPEERWIDLKNSKNRHKRLFDLPKILVGADVNRNSAEPLVVRLDTEGFCPSNHVSCLIPVDEIQKYNERYNGQELPNGWQELDYDKKNLWLLGLLASRLLSEISLSGRSARGITKDNILSLPLPIKVDLRIIDIVQEIVEGEKAGLSTADLVLLRENLDRVVEESYGNPKWISIQRTGISPELKAWQNEQENKKTLNVIGQVLKVDQDKNQVLLRLSGLLDDNEEEWLPLPQELPGWALDGTVFRAELSEDIETFAELAQRPWALRKFKHTPHSYLTNEELKIKLSRMIDKEN